jgi:hypothetical protein
MTRKSERKRIRKELVATYIRSNPTEGYDAISRRVNESIAELGGDAAFTKLAKIDNKLGLPKGTSFEMGGYADYFAFGDDCPPPPPKL